MVDGRWKMVATVCFILEDDGMVVAMLTVTVRLFTIFVDYEYVVARGACCAFLLSRCFHALLKRSHSHTDKEFASTDCTGNRYV
jgi:hypothetical protein